MAHCWYCDFWVNSINTLTTALITNTHTHCVPPLSASVICSYWHSTGSTHPDCNWTTKFCSQQTSHMEPSATSTTVTRPVGERLQAGTEDAPVVDRLVPLRRLCDSDAGYKYPYPDLLTYFLTQQEY